MMGVNNSEQEVLVRLSTTQRRQRESGSLLLVIVRSPGNHQTRWLMESANNDGSSDTHTDKQDRASCTHV